MTREQKIRAIYTVACFMAGAGTINNSIVQSIIVFTYLPVGRLWGINK